MNNMAKLRSRRRGQGGSSASTSTISSVPEPAIPGVSPTQSQTEVEESRDHHPASSVDQSVIALEEDEILTLQENFEDGEARAEVSEGLSSVDNSVIILEPEDANDREILESPLPNFLVDPSSHTRAEVDNEDLAAHQQEVGREAGEAGQPVEEEAVEAGRGHYVETQEDHVHL